MPRSCSSCRATNRQELGAYLFELVGRHRANPGDNLLSRLANDTSADRMADLDLVATGGADARGGTRDDCQPDRQRHADDAAASRTSSSGSARSPRSPCASSRSSCASSHRCSTSPTASALADIDIAGTTIPKGSRIVLLLAAANRDPELFVNPDQFDPDRPDIQHYGFGGGIHYCFGAPLARLEGQLRADGDRPPPREPATDGRSAALPAEPGAPGPDPPRSRHRRRPGLTAGPDFKVVQQWGDGSPLWSAALFLPSL